MDSRFLELQREFTLEVRDDCIANVEHIYGVHSRGHAFNCGKQYHSLAHRTGKTDHGLQVAEWKSTHCSNHEEMSPLCLQRDPRVFPPSSIHRYL